MSEIRKNISEDRAGELVPPQERNDIHPLMGSADRVVGMFEIRETSREIQIRRSI